MSLTGDAPAGRAIEPPDNGKVEWEVALIDLVPLAPLIGINLTGVDQSVLQVVKIILEKREAGRCNYGWNFK